MQEDVPLSSVKRVGTGLCFMAFPLVWLFAFVSHPGLLSPRLLAPAELIRRAHGDARLQFAHALVTANTALAIVIALHFMNLLRGTRAARAGLLGAAMAVFGACMLAAEKGALCLTMSAVDTLSSTEFDAMMPGLLAIFSFKGWLAMVWGLLFMPIGVLVQTVGMIRTRVVSPVRGGLLIVSLLFIGFPDGAEIVNLAAAVLMTAVMLPHGVQLIRGNTEAGAPR